MMTISAKCVVLLQVFLVTTLCQLRRVTVSLLLFDESDQGFTAVGLKVQTSQIAGVRHI